MPSWTASARKQGRRPDSGPGRQGVVVHLHWENDRCEVWLDTSGEPLSRRGYRKIPLEAPMQETLAAAVILATGWDGKGPFVNPMCGSGTLAIEGALIALGRAPGILRQNFGFMHLLGFDRAAFEKQREELKKAVNRKAPGRIIATDIRPEAVEAARQNARTAGVEHLIEFAVCDFRETAVPEGDGIVVLNPEYGERMGDAGKLGDIYKGIGDFFKKPVHGLPGLHLHGEPRSGQEGRAADEAKNPLLQRAHRMPASRIRALPGKPQGRHRHGNGRND